MRLRHRSRAFFCAPLAFVALACSASGEQVATEASHLYIASGATLWPPGSINGSTGTTFIPVCWASGLDSNGNGTRTPAMQDPNFATLQTWAYEALGTGWGGVANIAFTGWGQCQSNNPADYVPGRLGPSIMIRWTNPGEGGNSNVGYGTTSWTAIQLETAETLEHVDGSTHPESDFKGEVLHEFGHALGFAHESDRPDNPNPCLGRVTDPGGVDVTPYDYNSIMNYSYPCASDASGGIKDANGMFILSPDDIWGIQRLYGRKPQNSLVNEHAGRCLSVPGANSQYGIKTDLWDCGGYPDQRWYGASSTSNLGSVAEQVDWVTLPIAFRCLDVSAYGTSNGTSAQSWGCNGGANQRWAFPKVQIVGHGGNCLTNRSDGGIVMETCVDGDVNQQWVYDETRGLIKDYLGRCMQASGITNGAQATMAGCNGSNGQVWGLSDGQIRSELYGFSHPCLDVDGGGTTNGTPVWLWQCLTPQTSPGDLAAINQKWALRGNLVGYAGNCLDAEGAGMGDGNPVWMWQCFSPAQPQQVWTYYF